MNKSISKLQFITHDLPQLSHLEQVELACKFGVDWIQLRLKNISKEELVSISLAARKITLAHNVKLIINDYVDVAKFVEADGVHVGKNDTAIEKVREIVGNNMIVGGSTNTFEDILALSKTNVDYVGLGPLRWTGTKSNLNPILGIEGYQSIIEKCKLANITLPIIAIGGILASDIKNLSNVGIYGYAVASGLTSKNQFESNLKLYQAAVSI